MVREEAAGGAVGVWGEVEAEVGGPVIAAESRRDCLLAMIDKLGKGIGVLCQCTKLLV